MTLNPGTKLGPYEIIVSIGAGGFGEVYRARDTRLNRTVAIKVLSSHFSGNAEMKARFEREAQTIAGLNHAHICRLGEENENSTKPTRVYRVCSSRDRRTFYSTKTNDGPYHHISRNRCSGIGGKWRARRACDAQQSIRDCHRARRRAVLGGVRQPSSPAAGLAKQKNIRARGHRRKGIFGRWGSCYCRTAQHPA